MNELIAALTHNYYKACIVHEYGQDRPYCTGVIVSCPIAYSICPGKVVAIGKSEGTYAVSVLVNDFQLIRYTNLVTCDVKLNQTLTYDEKMGNCSTLAYNSTLAIVFEYCTATQSDSIWPVRIGSKTFYKHNPITLFNGTEKLVILSSEED